MTWRIIVGVVMDGGCDVGKTVTSCPIDHGLPELDRAHTGAAIVPVRSSSRQGMKAFFTDCQNDDMSCAL